MVKDRDNKTVWKQMCGKVNQEHAENGKGEQTPLFSMGVTGDKNGF